MTLTLSSCASKPNKLVIPKELLTPVDDPVLPELHVLIHKDIALYIIDLQEAIDKANLKIITIDEILNGSEDEE
jgi:hypothetical protein